MLIIPLLLHCHYKMLLGKFIQNKECRSALEVKNQKPCLAPSTKFGILFTFMNLLTVKTTLCDYFYLT